MKKPFTFEELWNWEKQLNAPITRQKAIDEATIERGYEYHQYTDADCVEKWELIDQDSDNPCATGHFTQ